MTTTDTGPQTDPTPVAGEPHELRSMDYCMVHGERHIIGHGGTEHHEGTPCEACDYLDAAAEHQALFDLQYKRMAEATALWRAESPDERELIQPDLGTLLSWLMGRAEAQRLTVERLPSDTLLAEAMHSTRSVGHRSHALEECDTMNVAYMEAWAGRVRDWLVALAHPEQDGTGETRA